jgi:hypothetical protein
MLAAVSAGGVRELKPASPFSDGLARNAAVLGVDMLLESLGPAIGLVWEE